MNRNKETAKIPEKERKGEKERKKEAEDWLRSEKEEQEGEWLGNNRVVKWGKLPQQHKWLHL